MPCAYGIDTQSKKKKGFFLLLLPMWYKQQTCRQVPDQSETFDRNIWFGVVSLLKEGMSREKKAIISILIHNT